MREIKVTINRDGTMSTEFHGFEGGDCFVEGEKLRQALAKFGIQTSGISFQTKPELLQEGHRY